MPSTNPEGGDTVTVFESILVALTFGILIVALVGLVVEIVRNMKK